jgi:hypothetical protein
MRLDLRRKGQQPCRLRGRTIITIGPKPGERCGVKICCQRASARSVPKRRTGRRPLARDEPVRRRVSQGRFWMASSASVRVQALGEAQESRWRQRLGSAQPIVSTVQAHARMDICAACQNECVKAGTNEPRSVQPRTQTTASRFASHLSAALIAVSS